MSYFRRLVECVARFFKVLAHQWRRHSAAVDLERERLRILECEGERLRVELSHLERELSDLNTSRDGKMTASVVRDIIRLCAARVEVAMLNRQAEIAASGHLIRSA